MKKYLLVFIFLLPASVHSEVDLSLRFGTGVSVLVNIPYKASGDTPRFSIPLMLDVGLMIDERFGLYLEGVLLFTEGGGNGHIFGGVYGVLKGEYTFFKGDNLGFYALLGLGYGGVLMWGYEDLYGIGPGTLNFGAGIEFYVTDGLSLGFEPRLRWGFPREVQTPSVELLLTIRV